MTLVDDDVHEDDETFALNLSMAENAAVSTASATGTIVDDDAAPELSITGGTAPEGGTIGFTVTLTGSTSRTATVDYATADGTAIADGDYEPVRGSLDDCGAGTLDHRRDRARRRNDRFHRNADGVDEPDGDRRLRDRRRHGDRGRATTSPFAAPSPSCSAKIVKVT